MSAKTILKPYQILKNQDMTTSFVSNPTSIQITDNTAYELVWSGTPAGIFNVQVSLDYAPGTGPNSLPINPGNWTNITLSTPVVASGTSNYAFIEISQSSSAYIRISYTATSGTGTVNGYVSGKSI